MFLKDHCSQVNAYCSWQMADFKFTCCPGVLIEAWRILNQLINEKHKMLSDTWHLILTLSLISNVCLKLEEYHSHRSTCASAFNKPVPLHYLIQFAACLNGVWHLQMKWFHHDCHWLASEMHYLPVSWPQKKRTQWRVKPLIKYVLTIVLVTENYDLVSTELQL